MDGHEGQYWFDEPLRGVSPSRGVTPGLPQADMKEDIKPDVDLANIENALLTVAESIKYLADTYAEVNKPPEPTEEEKEVGSLKPIPWRRAVVGDYIKLKGDGNALAFDHTGEVVRVTQDYPRVRWETLDGKVRDNDGISNLESRFTVME